MKKVLELINDAELYKNAYTKTNSDFHKQWMNHCYNEASKELLRYGEYIQVHDIEVEDGYVRIRIIEYKGSLYFHAMKNGEVVTIDKVQA